VKKYRRKRNITSQTGGKNAKRFGFITGVRSLAKTGGWKL